MHVSCLASKPSKGSLARMFDSDGLDLSRTSLSAVDEVRLLSTGYLDFAACTSEGVNFSELAISVEESRK